MYHRRNVVTGILLAVLSLMCLSHGAGAQALPSGQARFAYASANNPINTTATFTTGFVDVPNLATSITVPAGQVADVLILFSGEMNSPSALYVQAVVDGQVAQPGLVQAFWDQAGGATTQGFNFRGSVLGAGTHTIKMQWAGLSGQQFMSARSMTVILNLRSAISVVTTTIEESTLFNSLP
jgi:hypothetical protein